MKVLRFKYTHSEIFALRKLMELTVLTDESKEIEDRLLLAILMAVYLRIVVKTALIQDKYAFTFSAPEALAFTIYFNQEGLNGSAYEKRIVRMITAETDKKFL